MPATAVLQSMPLTEEPFTQVGMDFVVPMWHTLQGHVYFGVGRLCNGLPHSSGFSVYEVS